MLKQLTRFNLWYVSLWLIAPNLVLAVLTLKAIWICIFKRYPGVQTFMHDIREKAKAQGYVETLFGRRLYLPDINSSNGMRRKAAERVAINAPSKVCRRHY